jgi:hypothetical protein
MCLEYYPECGDGGGPKINIQGLRLVDTTFATSSRPRFGTSILESLYFNPTV